MEDGFALLAEVERSSRALRRIRRHSGPVAINGSVAIQADTDVERLSFVVPSGGWTAQHGVAPLAADAIIISGVPTQLLQFRAFYLDARLTISIHRLAFYDGSPLLRGSRVAERSRGIGSLVVPGQVERSRRRRYAWVVEELLPGVRASRRERPQLVPQVAAGVGELRLQSKSRERPIRRVVPWLSSRELAVLLRWMDLEPTDARRLFRIVDELAGSEGTVLAGWTHGDPARNNVLRLPEDGLGLVDWERAGFNPLGLDACRLLAALDDPTEAVACLEEQLRPLQHGRVLPLREQAALAVLGLMPTWARQRHPWQGAGRSSEYRDRNVRRLALLEHLLRA